jgi:hypothetical protein
MPSDHRPPHLFSARVAGEAVGAALMVECNLAGPVSENEHEMYDEDQDELQRANYKVSAGPVEH